MVLSAVPDTLGFVRDRSIPVTQPAAPAANTDVFVSRTRALIDEIAARARAVDDADRIDRIASIDAAISALSAARAEETAAFYSSQLDEQQRAGVSARRLGFGVSEQIARARKLSPAAGQRYVAFARALCAELPATLAAMRRGEVSEWVATLVARETAALKPADRRAADFALADKLAQLSPRQAEAAARRRTYEIDPDSAMRRSRTARTDRRVSIRPAPDTMALVTGFLPVEQGVAAWASLDRHARSLKATGDIRSLGQIMADTMVERLTGQATAAAVPIEIGLTMSADALLSTSAEPALLPGHGPIPAPLARELALGADASTTADDPVDCGDLDRAQVFLRRLVTDPVDGAVIAVDRRRRRFKGRLARFIVARDQTCRTPYCEAPIRHIDHAVRRSDGGTTDALNGRGSCADDNYAKEAPGWQVRPISGRGHRIEVTTPTGHRYYSKAPPALGP
jgi:hypothetical protein